MKIFEGVVYVYTYLQLLMYNVLYYTYYRWIPKTPLFQIDDISLYSIYNQSDKSRYMLETSNKVSYDSNSGLIDVGQTFYSEFGICEHNICECYLLITYTDVVTQQKYVCVYDITTCPTTLQFYPMYSSTTMINIKLHLHVLIDENDTNCMNCTYLVFIGGMYGDFHMNFPYTCINRDLLMYHFNEHMGIQLGQISDNFHCENDIGERFEITSSNVLKCTERDDVDDFDELFDD
jgi:hypothetical protein